MIKTRIFQFMIFCGLLDFRIQAQYPKSVGRISLHDYTIDYSEIFDLVKELKKTDGFDHRNYLETENLIYKAVELRLGRRIYQDLLAEQYSVSSDQCYSILCEKISSMFRGPLRSSSCSEEARKAWFRRKKTIRFLENILEQQQEKLA